LRTLVASDVHFQVPLEGLPWIVEFAALTDSDEADFAANPAVYYHSAFVRSEETIRGCACSLAWKMAQTLPAEQLAAVFAVCPVSENGACILSFFAKPLLRLEGDFETALHDWVIQYLSNSLSEIETATALFLVSKSLPALSEIDAVAQFAFGALTQAGPVAASIASKVIYRLCRQLGQIPDDLFVPLVRLIPHAVTHHALELVNAMMSAGIPCDISVLEHVIEPCFLSIFCEFSDEDNAGRPNKMLKCDFEFLTKIAFAVGNQSPGLSEQFYEVIQRAFNDTESQTDVLGLALSLAQVCMSVSDPLPFIGLVVEQLGSGIFLDYADEFAPLLREFVSQNPAFLETEMGLAMAHLLVAAIIHGQASDSHVAALLCGLIAIAQQVLGTEDLVRVIENLVADGADLLRRLSGWTLFAVVFLAGRGLAGLDEWLEFLSHQDVFIANDVEIHVLAIRKLAEEHAEARDQLLALADDLMTRRLVDLSDFDQDAADDAP
jgi:hypothetical protein